MYEPHIETVRHYRAQSMQRGTISATIITFNEEHNIRRCLESVRWMDEIIVVDSQSTDATIDICRQYTDKIFVRPWPGHVKQKQFALEQATCDWIISLDADECLSDESVREIRHSVLECNPAADGFIFPRKSWYLGRWFSHGGWYPDRKLRLVRRGRARWSGIDPHDKLLCEGTTTRLKHDILHYVYRDITHQLKTVDSFSTISAQQWHARGKRFRLPLLVLRAPIRFLETYVWKLGFLDGLPGLINSTIGSYYVFLKYAKLWELERVEKKRTGTDSSDKTLPRP